VAVCERRIQQVKKKTQIVVLVVSFIWLYTCVWGTKILWNRLV